MSVLAIILLYNSFSFSSREERKNKLKMPVHPLPVMYLIGLVISQFYCIVLHPFLPFADRLPFLPLMLTSVYCALGVVAAWFQCYVTMLKTACA